MADPKLHFHFREPTVGTKMPITDGTVKVEGLALEIVAQQEEANGHGESQARSFARMISCWARFFRADAIELATLTGA